MRFNLSPVSCSGPKPGIVAGLVKSHWFSAMPMKSRITGSLTQARRSAATVNSAGTPDRRNRLISVRAVIEAIEGRSVGSNIGVAVVSIPAASSSLAELVAAVPDGAAGRGSSVLFLRDSDACFNRDQRDTKFSCSLIFGPFFVAAAAEGRRRGPLTASLVERALDMVLGDEMINRLGDDGRHRHGFHQIIAGIR